jgi:hypothetical protein
MDLTSAQNSARNVGVATLVIGIVLLVAPSKASNLLRLGDHPAALRIIGASDLALVPGLLAGRHRARWMTARAGCNVAIAGYCLSLVRRERSIGAGVGVRQCWRLPSPIAEQSPHYQATVRAADPFRSFQATGIQSGGLRTAVDTLPALGTPAIVASRNQGPGQNDSSVSAG